MLSNIQRESHIEEESVLEVIKEMRVDSNIQLHNNQSNENTQINYRRKAFFSNYVLADLKYQDPIWYNPSENIIKLAIIPHTYNNTNLSFKKVGDIVNIETDMIAKYIENMIVNKENS